MHDVLVIHPVKSVARWIADVLRSRGHHPAVARSLDEVERLLCFVRFATVIAWLPSADLNALVTTLQMQSPSRPTVLILSRAAAAQLAAQPRSQGVMSRAIPLPMSSSALIEVVGNVRRRHISSRRRPNRLQRWQPPNRAPTVPFLTRGTVSRHHPLRSLRLCLQRRGLHFSHPSSQQPQYVHRRRAGRPTGSG